MSGQELADELRRQKPALRVLLVSGYQGGEVEGGSVALIRKPFAGRVLIERIREVMGSEGGKPC
jgi:FixJ family two-component response regulator